ncbi:non-ribosomal peptide synthase protein (TIGR01720 family)/amino acid adenylation domain-containing protein [Ruminiclostridium sufflavum DSM 19573]|uniref:Non-ribosomal peptide synthase protein (TIGR01720 family)/amino acid adenylation domain-containing protein n=1 Tax=Ruminiclostridium sufflavum DSM 19573 TaxID=1121337 RepID=A0A318XPN3_9FIRM|nr:non-ribosomal peptide synthetase [Ruminiclostridium sufflavum]PYG88042.1 non-ribosomal peptide synthase protein (TIGR01720 family)/amino acid adenylation domain-containing protein [Ruminiclostridium sufflavum DSM 19573]
MLKLTGTQKELYELEQYSGSGATCIAADIFIPGTVNEQFIKDCMHEILNKNDIFHLQISNEENNLVWKYNEVINYEQSYEFYKFDIEKKYRSYVQEKINQGLSCLEKLYFFSVVQLPNKFGIFIMLNHIIADAWTLSKLGEQFVNLYNSRLAGEEYHIDNNSYVNFMQQENKYVSSKKFESDKMYWKNQLEKFKDLVVLTNHSTTVLNTERFIKMVPLEESKSIYEFCNHKGISEYSLYMAALGAVFHNMSRAEQFYIGSTVLNRTGKMQLNTLGLFANTIPTYFQFLKEDYSLKKYIKSIEESIFSAFKHQKYTYNRILKENGTGKIFDVSLNFQPASLLDNHSLDITLYPTLAQTESLIIHITKTVENQYQILFDYQTECFEKWEIISIQEHMLALIRNMMSKWNEETDDCLLADIGLFSEEEEKVLVQGFNDTGYEVENTTMDAMFEQQAMKYPEKIAVILKNEKITYGTLDRRANYVADYLKKNGIGKGSFVAVNASKKMETISAILGVLKSGAAFVPIDPEYPKERINYILNDCQPAAILVGTEDTTFDTEIVQIVLGKEECGVFAGADHSPDDIAYMIYTSGTTGKPKGVLVEHHGIASLRDYFRKQRGFCEQDTIMQFASFSFDAAVSEITMSLLIGGTLCVVTEDLRNDIDALEEYLIKNNVTIGLFPPQYLTQINKVPFRILLTAGSESNHFIVEKFGKGRVYSNDYGPTETTVCATAWKYDGGTLPRHIPIGKPIVNKQIYIMNGSQLCGIGVPGELCVAGKGIARGYWNQPELTDEKFVKNPYGEGRMYRTGDMARWTEDGNIEFLGRVDNQIKMRGFRIEIGEIESVMRNVAGIVAAVVAVQENKLKNEKYLNGYYITDGKVTYDELLFAMRNKLPNYMIPSHIYEVTEIPLNRNGKVDMQKLKTVIIERKKEHSLPVTDKEAAVLKAFQDVIGNYEIGMEDNFFEVGGDSIKAIGIISALKAEGIHATVKAIIQHNSIQTFCKALDKIEQEFSDNQDERSIVLTKRDASIEYLPLTDIQQEIYLGAALDKQGIAYNVPMIIKFNEKLDIIKVQYVINELQRRHAAIRAGFKNTADGLVQFFRAIQDYEIELERAQSIKEAFGEFLKPFDLEKDRLLRVKLVMVDETEYLMFDSHHIVVDGLSMNLLFEEFIALYTDKQLEPAELDFDDYVQWSIGEESRKIMREDLEYWHNVFEDGVEKTLIPSDFERSGSVANEGETLYGTVSGDVFEGIHEFCSMNNVSPFMVLMSVYGVLISKLSLSTEIIIGVPTSGRFLEQADKMVGMFVSSIPFKMNLQTSESYIQLVKAVEQNLLEILKRQNCTMNKIAGELGISSENGQNPFFATMFGVNDITKTHTGKTMDYEYINFEQKMAKFDVTLDANKEDDHYQLVLRYNKRLYKESTMMRFMNEFILILEQVMQNSRVLIRDICILSKEEEQKLLSDNNNNKIVFEYKDANIVELFNAQVRETPNSIAAAFDGKYVTYAELDSYSDKLASKLESQNCGKGKIVPILTERSIEMLVMELAVMKTGAAFCPMDSAWPLERKELIYTKLKADYILKGPGCRDISLPHMEVALADIKGEEYRQYEGKHYDGSGISGSDTFYVIYTSGSTGQPKGVVVPYRGIINRLMWMNDTLGMKACSSVLLTTNYVYDSSIWQFYWPLINGGKVVIPKPDDMLTAGFLLDIIKTEKIGIVDFVPSVFNTIVDEMENSTEEADALDSLVWVILGGEEIKPKAVNRFLTLFPHLQCINLYGPTEASIGCVYKALAGNNNKTIPIGKPISNVDILILDKDMNLVPEGICGEIYIGGICLADGYLDDPERTEQSFVKNPFAQIKSERLYKTGDLAKWDYNGDIYYLGRSDSQVKIRGYRIELQEIEAKILDYAGVKECIVLTIDRRVDDKVLCAYFVGEVDEAELKNYLFSRLPAYMVPSYYIKLDQIPIGTSGKANRNMLSKPDFTVKKNVIIAPQNEVEGLLAEAWAKVLNLKEISMDDNYFEIGGDSIKALQIVSMLRKNNLEFTMQQLFANPTIKQLAKTVNVKREIACKTRDFTGELALSPIQKRFVAHYDYKRYFNQAVLLENKDGWNQEYVEKAQEEIIRKHPMIRASYQKEQDGAVIQNILPADKVSLRVNICEKGESLDKTIETLQKRIAIDSNIVEFTLIKDGNREYLFLAAHHLIIDAVSMRILVNDFMTIYKGLENGESVDIGTECLTYSDYLEKITKACYSYHFKKQKAYWEEIDQYKKENQYKTAFGDRKSISVTLVETCTNLLNGTANRAYGTRTEELLLTAFLNALKAAGIVKERDVVIDMESMGRNITQNGMDFSETVGWFTTIYPVHFQINQTGLAEQVINVKETMRKVPDKGIGYQLIHYHDGGKAVDSQICFNYLGELSVAEQMGAISIKSIDNKSMIHKDMQMPYIMDVSASILENRLTVSFDYVPDVLEDKAMGCFASEFEKQCQNIAKALNKTEEIVKTPADYGRSELSIKELNYILSSLNGKVEKIYPLTATQTGILFHTITEGGTGAYFEQNYLTIQGNIELGNFRKAYCKLIEQYDIFKTVFMYDNLSTSYQVVKSIDAMEILFESSDIAGLDKVKQQQVIEEYCVSDKKKGFDLQRGPLMRVMAFKTDKDTWKLVWSDSHILMDGMCLAVVLDKVTTYYNQLCQGESPIEEQNIQYSDYIDWLQEQDMEEAAQYWKDQVYNYEKPNELYKSGNKQESGQNEIKIKLDKKIADSLTIAATNRGLTLNSIMQAAWAVTLMRYCDTNDIVYGSVLSGRSAPVKGIEDMIGLFISTLPIRVTASQEVSFTELARQVQTTCVKAEGYSYYPLASIQKFSEYGSQLFDHIFVFENFDLIRENKESVSDNAFRIVEASADESTNYDLTIVVIPRREIEITFMYKKAAFNDAFMEQILCHYQNVLTQVAGHMDRPVAEMEVLGETDYQLIDVEEAFNIGFTDVTITELFEEQVRKYPDRTAIQYGEERYTYQEAGRLSNRIANTLVKHGIQTEDIIGILMEKNSKAVITALGILKAGGAYMPLDPSYPAERLEFMISDSNAKLVVTAGNLFDVTVNCPVIDFNTDLEENDAELALMASPENLAYIIYTSGTTGKPKGAMIFHRNVIRLFVNDNCLYDFTEQDVWVMFHSFCFDFSVWEMYGALLFGGKLIIISKDFARDTYKFMKFLENEKVTILNQTPSAFNSLSLQLEIEPGVELAVRYVIFGGEKLHPAVVKYFHSRYPSCKIINMYGITETTVHVTYKEITEKEIEENVSDIGLPIPTLGLVLVDSRLKPVPRGMQGELLVWGHGVCRGYINRPELTEAKFIKYTHNGKELYVYRSGDAGRFIDGGLEYIGRIDQQVKIRGHRIELGEIKNIILKNEKVEDCVVIVDADAEDNKFIIAYYQQKQELDYHELRSFMEEHLPGYMVPAYFMPIKTIPVNINGKVDKKALPKPEIKSDLSRYVKAENAMQQYIVDIWEEILDYAPISIDDNYFEIGGDSIKVIKILSKVHSDGYHFEVADLFAHPTIREFYQYMQSNKSAYSQDEIAGKMLLTPIQKELSEDEQAMTGQYNQAIILHSEEHLDEESLMKALKRLVIHHDSLRSVFVKDEDNSYLNVLRAEEMNGLDALRVEHLENVTEDELDCVMEAICNEEQEAITLISDKLYRMTLMVTSEGDYVFFAVHHMVIDVVSWNIIAEDLTRLYHDEQNHTEVILPEKTMSFKQWTDVLYSDELKEELKFNYESLWRGLAKEKDTPVWETTEYGTFGDTVSKEFNIDVEITEALKNGTFRVTGATMEEVLLSIMVNALAAVSGKRSIPLALESTGRFAKYKDYDFSRTVGWFTAIYPIVFEPSKNPVQLICVTKEKRRKAKNLEYTFGLIADVDPNASRYAKPQISFNYLGQIQSQENGFTRADKAIGKCVGDALKRQYAMDISCKIENGRLHFTTAYSKTVVSCEFVTSLIEEVKKQIEDTVQACKDLKNSVTTPVDYNLDISIEELDYLKVMYGGQADSFMRMTPMQKGMLYHIISNPDDDAYHERLVMNLTGQLSSELLIEALNITKRNHIALRTAFVSENITEPVQIILKDTELGVKDKDVRGLSEEDTEKIIEAFDIEAFNYASGDLCRFLILKTGEEAYQVIWKFHHLILDGWSVSIILEELFKTYTYLKQGEQIKTEAEKDNCRDLYDWIGTQNMYAAKKFWKQYLGGRELNTQIPFEHATEDTETCELDSYLDEEYTDKLKAMSNQSITSASVVISAWGLLLQMTNLADEAVFGSIVSGRNKKNESVNNAAGMFINTIPVCVSMEENETFIDSARRFQDDLIKMEQYSYYPLYEIQSDANNGNQIINHVVAYENYPVNQALKEQLENGNTYDFAVENVVLKEHTNYSVGVVFTPGSRMKLNLSYNKYAFKESKCQRIAQMYFHILKQVIDNPLIQKKDISLLSATEEKQLVGTYEPVAYESLMEQFERASRKCSLKTAVKDRNTEYSYEELRLMANGLAKALHDASVVADETVCLMCGAGVEQAIGILGIMKANAIYLPVDTSLPIDRIRYMIDNSRAVRIVSDKENVSFAEQFGLPVTTINPEDKYETAPASKGKYAYIIYTSGTTGKPKGVLVSKENIASAIGWRSKEYDFAAEDNILQLFAYSFDGFMTSFFTPLVSGCKIVFVEDVLNVRCIGEVIEKEKITHFISVPILCQSIFENLTAEQLQSVRIVTTAGDRLSVQTYKAVKEKIENIEIVNEYGPTECTVVSTIKRNVSYGDIADNSIGHVIENGYLYIADKNMNILPDGLAGEIVMGGQGVSCGYVNSPGLTAKAFVKDKNHEGLLVYRTGDKGKRLENGEISFLGRVDKQVKVRGYRIETLEIEKIMEEMQEIESAAVIVYQDELIAYYVGEEDGQNIKKYLSTKLPKYMIPAKYIKLDAMPLTYIGKVDYKNLPSPVYTEHDIVKPASDMEWEIWNIWEGVLGHQSFGVTDNFFEVGGNSIRLMSVSGKLNKAYPDKFTVASLFSYVTIKDICGHVEQEDKSIIEKKETTELAEDDILAFLEDDNADLDDLINRL